MFKKLLAIALKACLISTLVFNLLLFILAKDDHGNYQLGMMIFSIVSIPASLALSFLFYRFLKIGRNFILGIIICLLVFSIISALIGMTAQKDNFSTLSFWAAWLTSVLILNYYYWHRDKKMPQVDKTRGI